MVDELICHKCESPIKYPFKAIWLFGRPYHRACVSEFEIESMRRAKAQSKFFREE